MKILTKKKQKRLMQDLLDIYTMGSDALKSIGTHQPMDETQALRRQMKMIDAAMDAANIIRGFYGNMLLMAVDKRKAEMEEEHGFPIPLPKQQGESDINVKDNGDGTMTFEVPDAVEAARNFDPYPPLGQEAVEKTFKIIYPEDTGDSEKWVLYHIVLEHSGLLTSERLVEYATDKDSEFMRREMLREFCDTLRRAWVNDMPGGTFMDHLPHVKVDYSEYVNGGKIIVEFSMVFLH